ncbi:hypothetical protein IWW36_002727 [Coemansia brasiliensis]|uniref:Ser-Thr-rich glycosyl-phosphatidyl-inositol-anchored membrane family-domain-containing protein n=1 Tax=Coemansia brasiliensis TaxID=2650707 RepID=A0A9W8I930_9FUNG|nr:hypothetical protein IWW36_002727 [Coemansia brasiliensis]
MVSFSTLAASVLAFTSAAQAGFYTTYPIGSDAIKPGQTIQITWRPDEQAPDLSNVSSYTLKYMTGGNLVQTTVATIGTFDISQTTIPFTVPDTAPGMYFLMYTAGDGSGSSWSTRFSVGGGTSWYPDGVATGRDPSTSDEPSLSDGPTASGEPTSEQPPPSESSSSRPGGDIGDATDISATGTDKPTSNGNDGSQPPHTNSPTASESGKENNPTDGGEENNTESTNNQPGSGSSEDIASSTSGSNGDSDSSELGNVSGDSEEPSNDGNSHESGDEESTSEDKSSLSDEESDTTSGSSAVRMFSAAAVVVASVFLM